MASASAVSSSAVSPATGPGGVDAAVCARIGAMLDEIEATRGVRILMAVESGSRAWNMASPDSDFDIRGVFVPADPTLANLHRALHVPDHLPLDITFFSDDRLIDVSLWDVRKAAALLSEGKTALLEWARSPIVYRSTPSWPSALLSLGVKSAGLRGATLRHYVGLMRSGIHQNLRDERVEGGYATRLDAAANTVISVVAQLRKAVRHGRTEDIAALSEKAHAAVDAVGGMLEERKTVAADVALTAKKLSYVLLPAVYIQWLLQHEEGLPPLDLELALSQVDVAPDVRAELTSILAAKRSATEKHRWTAKRPVFDAWVADVDARVAEALGRIKGRPLHVGDAELLDLVLAAEGK